jgi:hypothetical protein
MEIKTIIEFLDKYLEKTGRNYIDPVEANIILEKAGLLRNSKDRPGKPLRDLLRKGHLPHAFQSGGKGTAWTIPHSKNHKIINSNYSIQNFKKNKKVKEVSKQEDYKDINFEKVKEKLEKARSKYLPKNLKYILIAEAPPDSLERFFYYEDVRQHDYLFLGIAQALYPDLKTKFLETKRDKQIKKVILENFKSDGFFLLDLSELPISLLKGKLENHLPSLKEKIEKIADKQTQIILIKANVFDIAYSYLIENGFKNVIDIRIPFPGQGGQKKFQKEFQKALKRIGYEK